MLRQLRATARENVAGDTDLDWNPLLRQIPYQLWIVDCMQPVADAVGFQLAEGAPDRPGPNGLPSMYRQAQAVLCGMLIHLAELLWSSAALVAPESDPDHVSALEANSFFDHLLRLANAEVPHGVKDPIQRDTKVALAALPPALQPFEQRSEFLLPPQHHANRDEHFGMGNVLRAQLLYHAIGDELVVLGRAQTLGDRFKGPQKSGEVLVLVQLAGFLFGKHASAVFNIPVAIICRRQRRRMASAQFGQRRRINRSFEVQVELGLRQRNNKGAGSACLPWRFAHGLGV